MRVVILLDRSFAKRERDLLSRLEIGLADEGVRVVHAVPAAILETETGGLYSAAVGYDDRGFPTTPGRRLRDLAESVAAAAESQGQGGVDVVHAFGDTRPRLAVALAAALRAVPVLEGWRTASFGRLAEESRRVGRGATLLFGDEYLRSSFEATHPRLPTQLAPWGVHAGDTGVVGGAVGRAPAAAVLIEGTHPLAVRNLLEGLRSAAVSLPDLMVFADMDKARSGPFWKLARQFGLLDRLSIVPGIEARREPILRLDTLIVPEPSGKLRSLVLDAMARGVPVIAAPDPALGILSRPDLVRLVETGTPEAWARAVQDTLAAGPAARAITSAAQAFIRSERTASAHVAAVLRAYEAALARGPAQTRV